MTHHPSKGTIISWDPAGGTSYTAIGQVKDISGPSISRGDIDVTDHDSAAQYREYLPGLSDAGVLTFPIGFDSQNTAHGTGVGTGLLADLETEGCTLAAWQVVKDDCGGTATWTYDGYVNGFTWNAPVEGELTADLGVKISGKPTLTIS